MKNFRLRLQALCFALLCVVTMSAQEKRYVVPNGAGAKNGSSWTDAFANIQDAINDLVNNNKTGEVWVMGATDGTAVYYPTETTQASGSQYYKAFKIPAGITVRGGFAGTETEASQRITVDDKNFGKGNDNSGTAKPGKLDGEDAKSGVYKYKTILCGDITPSKHVSFTWNETKGQFDATFYGNSYHVVWFAMNGFNSNGRANPLAKPAKLEGCVVEGGHAYTNNASVAAHPHEGYGGGIYMVANSFVYNCEVRNCDASRNGGGIYMDGGGIVRRTLVHNCQTLGLGTEFGLGGGICENGSALNSKANPIVVAQSVVTNCVGRMGGGMALLADATQGNNKYAVVANSTLVNNNTAQIEAGGVYTYKGGGLSSMTIVKNKCDGSGITQNGRITGRSGGVYSYDPSYIGNTVIWGNECEANNDMQFANANSSLSEKEKTKFYYNALSNADVADWSKSEKMGVLSLDNDNKVVTQKGSKGYPLFFKPTATAGYLESATTDNTLNWQVSSESFLSYAGIATVDLDYEGLTPAPAGKNWDMQFGEFNSRPSIGALISQVPDIAPAQNITYEGVKYDYAFFVDPNFIYAADNERDNGTDWEHPARFLGTILDFVANKANDYDGKKVAVFVKEGTVDNTRIGGNSRVRVTSLEIPSNVSLFGSYSSHLHGTDVSLRNVVHTPTIISAQLMNSYRFNLAHLININDKHNILIEGFKLSYANASSTALANDNKNGAAITVVNSEDIRFRNIIISNCTADLGAAVYADKSKMHFENCIFHNNQTETINNSGVIYATNGSELDFDHCDVLRNVGHASFLGSNNTTNHWQNSIFYGNMDRAVADTNEDSGAGLSHALAAFSGNTVNATGSRCMFDSNSASFATQFGNNDTGNKWQYNLQYSFVDGTGQGYPRFVNPTKNAGVTEDGDQTYYGRGVSFEPHNNNPVVNMANHADLHTSWGQDLVNVTRDFGGLPDIGAVENHEATHFEEGENAYTDGQRAYGDAYYVRDYSSNGTNIKTYNKANDGTLTENAENKGIYNAAGELLDGASWEYAVNGNGLYEISGSTTETVNTIFKTETKTTPSQFDGTFTIKTSIRSTDYYIYIDNSGNVKISQTAADASHFEVQGITDKNQSLAGNRYIRAKVGSTWYYLNASPGRVSGSTSEKTAAIEAKNGAYTIAIDGNYYYTYLNWLSYALGATVNSKNASTWTFTADMTDAKTQLVEVPYQQDGKTEVTGAATRNITASTSVNSSLDFHVYNSLDDYNKSETQTTYTIKRNASNNYLRNSTVRGFVDYFYPGDNGDEFILIQDGEYGKYYIYDVTTKKYLYYSNNGLRASATYKSTWWVKENNGALCIVYGNQPWDTTGSYALSIGTNNQTAVTLGQKTADNAKLVLVAKSAYDVYNYQSTSKEAVNLNGLQYAVNLANEKFAADNKAREVYVGKGIYTNKTNADGDNTVQQPYAYMIKEGVNVYGGFPENGNPGMNERQPKTFVTVLQPQEGNPHVTLGEHHVYRKNNYNTDLYAYTPTNWGANATDGSEQASVGRVLVQPTDFTVKTAWDGFTIQHGYLFTARMHNIGSAIKNLNTTNVKTAGGAGVLLQNNGVLTNCEVKDNLLLCYPGSTTEMTKTGTDVSNKTGDLYTFILGGAGVFMTGANSVVENSQIYNNQVLTKPYNRSSRVPDNLWMLGGGLYQDNGQVYNTIIHDNVAATVHGRNYDYSATGSNENNEMVLGGGAFIASGNFYNNTIVNNQSATIYHCHNNHCTFAGVHVKNDARIYNSIIADNTSHWGYETYYSDPTNANNPGQGIPVSAFENEASKRDSRDRTKVYVKYSFVDVKKNLTRTDDKTDLVSYNDTEGNSGAVPPYNTNVYLNWDQKATSARTKDYTTAQIYNKFKADATDAEKAQFYHIFINSPAFNSGTEDIANVEIPGYDAEYTERVKDCRIDIGAFELNSAASITPDVASVTGQAIFYVTPDGYGDMSAKNPENAACAAKLQHVIDAAGRYKYTNPGKQVIVKVANSYDMYNAIVKKNEAAGKKPGEDGYETPSNFTYYATRTTDWTDQDVRLWSIIIPRGVEVWGGYTDKNSDASAWTNSKNGFQTRNITKNPTYFDSYYENKLEQTDAITYHVVTFTDRVYDTNGLAYLKNEASKVATGADSNYKDLGGTDEGDFLHMTNVVKGDVIATQINGSYASNRAVLDGIFVSGGQADAASNGGSAANVNSYGGAALVNEHAYVRNCILAGNSAINGGALALTDHALVSGCLIMDNEAYNQGGGIYVFEEGTKLSNGTTINSLQQKGDPSMDARMAHVLTSTIVANKAQQGGGVWYTSDLNANARFNSVAIWQNEAVDQPNVYGTVNPEQPTDDNTISEIFYPFAYSLIQNVRASGTNNLSAEPLNSQGVRFVNKTHDVGQTVVDQFDMAEEAGETSLQEKLADFGFYGLTTYSLLSSAGMPKTMYNQLKAAIAIADKDILNTSRTVEDNSFVEIGARALPKEMPTKQLMLRLFVANPKDVDTKTAGRFMRLGRIDAVKNATAPTQSSTDEKKANYVKQYYSQEGSSFAYPFNSLQDALDYVKLARNGKIIDKNTDARNLPFEILVGKGTYYPARGLNGQTANVWSSTFAIPEGVTIIGGFDPEGGVSDSQASYYGRYYKKSTNFSTADGGSIYDNVDPIPTEVHRAQSGEIGRGYVSDNETVILPQVGTPAEGDEPASRNYAPAKTITFQQWNIQDIADRRAMADNNKNGIIEPWEFANQTIISGNSVNGETDGVYHIMTAVADADAVGLMPKVKSSDNSWTDTGYKVKEEGQQIRLNGLVVTGGNALTYLSSALDSYGSYIFYQGAGLQVDGNRYNSTIGGTPVFHNSAAYGVGYRDIPVSITNCQFRNNVAGYGGAISSNGSLSIFGSSFEQNKAVAATERPDGETWKGIGGATISEVSYPGQGGAILATYQLSAFNTLFANNEAAYDDKHYAASIDLFKHQTFRVPVKNNASPTLRAAGGAIMMGSAANHHIVNCDFVRNKANAYPAVFTMNPTKQQQDAVDTHDYSQIINTVAWGNEVNEISSNADYLRASKLMVNIGKKNRPGAYDPSFATANVPSEAALSSDNAEGTEWQEAAWFCAYEDGVGFKQNNTKDLRDAIVYNAAKFAPTMIREANGTKNPETQVVTPGAYQNCNIRIVADNGSVDGPNFGTPSVKAGFDGFMEGADWSPSRFNKLTDNGNGWIKQTVTTTASDITVAFNNNEAVGTGYQGAYPVTHYISELDNEHRFPEYKLWLALGSEKYMQATNETDGEKFINETSIGIPNKNYPRISADPTVGVQKAYIDIGVYEYQKQPLLKPGSEVDILWVSTTEHPENGKADGATWRTPTSDLQRAIETLLSSRNGHKKEIRLMEGEYAPVTPKTVNGTKYNAFVIDTKSLNAGAIVPSGWADDKQKDKYYAQSLTIKGGYSSEIMYEYDPVAYKSVIRQNGSDGNNTDYLIYVADPTVRYYYDKATDYAANNEGATWGTDEEAESYTQKTMPIQVDGVTLINDKASENKAGSAIYYPDVTPTAAHSVNVGGTVTYYTDKEHTKPSPNNAETDYPVVTGGTPVSDYKILITKTEIIGSGNKNDAVAIDADKTPSAVYIGKNGGAALIYNTVFHSNYGMPLDAYNTINVNNTFGLNKGMVRLQNASESDLIKSQMHNTALWKNNETSKDVYDNQVLFGTAAPELTNALFTYNSFTGCTEGGDGQESTKFNTALVNDNSNIGQGPNFVDPENADIEARNFDLKPSIRLLNKGMDESIESGEGKYYTLVVNNKFDLALASTTDKDALYRNRLKATRIDIGAYEFQGSINSILYVDPNKSHSDAATGANWTEAFGYGDLQNAVDLASISHATDKAQEAYVFVKGNSSTNTGQNTNETLTIRDGVTVYGSIGSDYNDWHNIPDPTDNALPKYRKQDPTDHSKWVYDIDKYIADMTNQREGVASDAASKTIVTGIKTADGLFDGTPTVSETEYDTPALVDGFVVTDPNSPKTPVLDITNPSEDAVIVVRNVVVADNDMTKATATDANVAEVSNGLIYEVLMRDNKPKGNGAVLKVSNNNVAASGEKPAYTTKGYAVNVTVEGKTVGADGTEPVDGENESATQIYNSITNSISNDGEGAYGNITNKGISGYFYNIADPNLNYQLTETSKYIDMCDAVNPLTGIAPNLAKFINYTTDRDILGNPRLLTGVTDGNVVDTKTYLLDRGAFETWKVDNDANGFQCGDNGTIAKSAYLSIYGDDDHAAIKKHFYPHDGSVVYIMNDQSLVIDAFDPEHEVKATPHNPGFMLVKEGANFYGNGRPATCAFLAIERKVKATGSIVSVPYAMKYKDNVATVAVDDDTDELILTKTVGKEVRTYNGDGRSDWKYIFQDSESPCWDAVRDGAVVAANTGVFYMPTDGTTSDDITYRFTAQGANLTDYVYTETTADNKTVTLTKYDDAESTDNGADFTDNLDMGWNCFGIPYLVSDYMPYLGKNGAAYTEGDYMMQNPHTLWLYYDGVHTPDYDPENDEENEKLVDGDGGYYSVKSWSNNAADWHVSSANDARIWVGEGIFTQTAAINGNETLTFYRPVAPATFASAKGNARYFYDATGIVEIGDIPAHGEDGYGVESTEYYTVNGMKIDKPTHGVVIIRQTLTNGSVRTIKRTMK